MDWSWFDKLWLQHVQIISRSKNKNFKFLFYISFWFLKYRSKNWVTHMWQGSHRKRYELLQTSQCTFLKHFSITNNIWKRIIFSVDGLLRYRNFKIWCPLKQTKSKNGRHFFISTFENLQLCFFVQKGSSTLKVLKMQFVFGWAYDSICNVPYYGSAKDKLHF